MVIQIKMVSYRQAYSYEWVALAGLHGLHGLHGYWQDGIDVGNGGNRGAQAEKKSSHRPYALLYEMAEWVEASTYARRLGRGWDG